MLWRCVFACVFFPFILEINFVGRTSRGHTGRSQRIFRPPSFCGACLYFSREKDSAVPFPSRPCSRILCTNDFIVLHLLGIFIFYFLARKNPLLPGFELTSRRVRRLRGYQLSYRGDRFVDVSSSIRRKMGFAQSPFPRFTSHLVAPFTAQEVFLKALQYLAGVQTPQTARKG